MDGYTLRLSIIQHSMGGGGEAKDGGQAHRVRFTKPSAIEALFVTFKEIALLFLRYLLELKTFT